MSCPATVAMHPSPPVLVSADAVTGNSSTAAMPAPSAAASRAATRPAVPPDSLTPDPPNPSPPFLNSPRTLASAGPGVTYQFSCILDKVDLSCQQSGRERGNCD